VPTENWHNDLIVRAGQLPVTLFWEYECRAGSLSATALQTSPDPVNRQIHAAIKKLMDTYRPQIKVTPPVAEKSK
jgi:hypothetical protein